MVNSVTTASYTYDDAGQLTSDGTTSYSYDDAGNLTAAGSDTYTWDWNNRLTSATVGSTTESYSYDGNDVRVGKTVSSVTTEYVWDRPANGSPRTGCSCDRANGAPLPLLVDDGSKAYLHADGLLAEIDGTNAATYLLGDILGSVRGLTNGSGTVTGSASYDVFGAIRSQTGTTSGYGFTGEQRDATTGFTYLRARYLSQVLGRFGSQDTVQPNAPGTQGWNLYAYVANNPTTLVDPSGMSTSALIGCVAGVASAVAWLIAAIRSYFAGPLAGSVANVGAAALALVSAIAFCFAIILMIVKAAGKFLLDRAKQINPWAPFNPHDLMPASSTVPSLPMGT
jgi:RHS repeat-associated protein